MNKSESDLFKNAVYKTIDLEKKRHCISIRIEPEIQTDMDIYSGQMIVRALNDIVVRKVETIKYKWPSDWVQAVKLRFAPEWFLNRYPVKYTEKGHEVYVHYPDFDIHNCRQVTIMDRIGK